MSKEKSIQEIQNEFIDLVAEAGNDYRAEELLDEITYGFGPSRATITRMRKGECKDTYLAMATRLLKIALKE